VAFMFVLPARTGSKSTFAEPPVQLHRLVPCLMPLTSSVSVPLMTACQND
jgi:hypothetical protein